ncbi:homeobox protein [Anaeramoeba ignava]|uniref:Homeobox protein n=1 Tax=Anaeramoeba ignava TaxID=1746090 RepID=A0A9Q0R8V4_ANAIG|nr:homeobox protein [Anaeramoeba ignava]
MSNKEKITTRSKSKRKIETYKLEKDPQALLLPTESKRILLIWLFYNIQNPYPSKKEKQELCEKANMNLDQVNHFFINARRRILRPIVEAIQEEEKNKESPLTHQMRLKSGRKIPVSEIDFEHSPSIKDRDRYQSFFQNQNETN